MFLQNIKAQFMNVNHFNSYLIDFKMVLNTASNRVKKKKKI